MIRYADVDVEAAMMAVKEVLSNETDSRAKLKAAEMIINHEKDVHQYENPKAQQHEHTVKVPNVIEIKLV